MRKSYAAKPLTLRGAEFGERPSLRTLIAELATLVRNTCRSPGAVEHPATFDLLTMPTALQRRAFELIDQIAV